MPFEALSKGYVLIPKRLLTYSLNQKDKSLSYLEAFLMVITRVNYEDQEVNIKDSVILCKRGESFLSFANWAKLFNWTVGKTRCFFSKMVKENLISMHHIKYGMKCIKVIDYDIWTGKPEKNPNINNLKTEQFKVFWEEYHKITKLSKKDIGAAERAWARLPKKERDLAIEKIHNYCKSTDTTKYFQRADIYLINKCYFNEGL